MSTKPAVVILADLGGSNARFALADSGRAGYLAPCTLRCTDFPSPDQALRHYLKLQDSPAPDAMCIAAAGPVVGDVGNQTIRMTNHPWLLDARQLSESFGSIPVRLLNDFAAVAWCLPMLDPADVSAIGPAAGLPDMGKDFTVGLLGPGTGLGVSGLLYRGGRFITLPGEGGHVGFAPETSRQVEAWSALHQLHGRQQRVYQERVLSGPGLEELYQAMAHIHGQQADDLAAAEIFRRAEAGSDDVALETVDLFFEVLGQAAGNQALTIGAFQGVFIAGGIVRRYPALLRASRFREGFENKGSYNALMKTIPTLLVEHPEPGLLGAAFFARQAGLAD